MGLRSLNAAQVAEAQRLIADGVSAKDIAERFGVHPQTVRRATDPRYREQRRKDIERRRLRSGRSNPAKGETCGRISVRANTADAEARLAEIPDDTRDLTARLMGDPIPGRSALDQSAD